MYPERYINWHGEGQPTTIQILAVYLGRGSIGKSQLNSVVPGIDNPHATNVKNSTLIPRRTSLYRHNTVLEVEVVAISKRYIDFGILASTNVGLVQNKTLVAMKRWKEHGLRLERKHVEPVLLRGGWVSPMFGRPRFCGFNTHELTWAVRLYDMDRSSDETMSVIFDNLPSCFKKFNFATKMGYVQLIGSYIDNGPLRGYQGRVT